MPDQTPVQIAWVTRDLDATERALTTLLGAKKMDPHARCPLRSRHMHVSRPPRGLRIEFAYVSGEAAGVPYIEIAHISPEIRAFFDHVKQEQQ